MLNKRLESKLNFFTKHWPLLVAMATLWVTVSVLLIISIKQNQGHFVYALDDPYIHMAIAKNFSQHGVWGVTEHGFTSSSSSPLWTLLLSLTYLIGGVNELSPFILNVVFATLLVILVYVLLRRYELPPLYSFLILLSVIFFTPLPALIFTGMEHVLQVLSTISFVYLAARILAKDKSSLLELSLFFTLAPLLTMLRYEGLFLVIAVVALLAIRRRLLLGLFLLTLAIVPIAIYGVISASHGWYFLPNSVLLKASIPTHSIRGIVGYLYSFLLKLQGTSSLFILLCIAVSLMSFRLAKQRTLWKDSSIMVLVFIAATFLHMLFANTGWFFRYEAYLVAVGIFVIAVAVRPYLPQRISISLNSGLLLRYGAICVLAFLLVCPLALRGLDSARMVPRATTNIYQQQYQMGLFIREFYQGQTVALNDIGAVNYLADVRCLDLTGLGSQEVAQRKLSGHYDTYQIYCLAKQEGVKVAVVYDHWFAGYGGLPSQWHRVGQWEISNNVVCGGDIVSWYVVDPQEESKLILALSNFRYQLPAGVGQSGYYIDIGE